MLTTMLTHCVSVTILMKYYILLFTLGKDFARLYQSEKINLKAKTLISLEE